MMVSIESADIMYHSAMKSTKAPGKIILTGEHAVVHGYPGIAVPAPLTMKVTLEEDSALKGLQIHWDDLAGKPEWQEYLKLIISRCGIHSGTLTIENQIPLGKGMGSSTALIIAVARCLLGDDAQLHDRILAIEDELSPNHSGIDFAVIWNEKPIRFEKGSEPKPIKLPDDILNDAILIDTGTPNETTSELLEFVRNRCSETAVVAALETIGICTERLEDGDDIKSIFADHHKAQVTLGVVPDAVQELIANIEKQGGAAKVLGAGGRTGGGGMVLAVGVSEVDDKYSVIRL